MRWNKREPRSGNRRVKSWFAIFPVTINGETRWLEKVKVLQQFCMTIVENSWKNIEFVN